jgi:hypothetical protein
LLAFFTMGEVWHNNQQAFETKMTEHGIDRVRMLIFMSAGAALTFGWVAFLAWLASKVWLLW